MHASFVASLDNNDFGTVLAAHSSNGWADYFKDRKLWHLVHPNRRSNIDAVVKSLKRAHHGAPSGIGGITDDEDGFLVDLEFVPLNTKTAFVKLWVYDDPDDGDDEIEHDWDESLPFAGMVFNDVKFVLEPAGLEMGLELV